MPHVNQLVDEFGSKGLVVVGVCDDTDSEIKGYVEETGTTMVIAQEQGLPSMKAFGFNGFPSAALVDPKGTVVWTGHPASLTDNEIKKNLKGVRMGGSTGLTLEVELPKKHSKIADRLAKGDLGGGWRDLDKALESPTLKEEDLPVLQSAIASLEALKAEQLAQAKQAHDEGRFAREERIYQALVKHFKGHETADKAQISLAELVADETIAEELAAGRTVLEAEDLLLEGKGKKALSLLSGLLDGKYGQTKEAQAARELYDELSSER